MKTIKQLFNKLFNERGAKKQTKEYSCNAGVFLGI